MADNDFKKGDKIEIGQKIYLEPKKEKAKEPYDLVKKGETLRQISQTHGLKLSVLCKNNHLKTNYIPKPGEILFYKKKSLLERFRYRRRQCFSRIFLALFRQKKPVFR